MTAPCTCGHDLDDHETLPSVCSYPGCACRAYVLEEAPPA